MSTRVSRPVPFGSLFADYERLISIVALYLASLVVLGPTIRFSQWTMSPDNNQAACEGMAWVEGHLDLPARGTDVALYKGKNYNVFPPLWPIVSYAYYSLQIAVIGPPPVFYPLIYNLLVSIPMPLLLYLAFRRTGARPAWAAVLAFQMMAGTCMWPISTMLYRGWVYSLQLVLANTGIALLAIGLLGKQRFWLAGIGVIIASWSRQTCLAYALAVVVLAWQSERRCRSLLQAAIPLAIAVAVPMVLNQIKFDSPFETGYRYIFQPGEDPANATGVYNEDGTISVFAARFVPGHFYSMWLDPPSFEWTYEGLRIEGNKGGNAIWIATPMLLLVFFDFRRWWADRRLRWMVLSTLPIIVAHLFYHGPVIGQPGFYRYSLDFVLVWLIAAAPSTFAGRQHAFALAAFFWSVLYFYTIARPGL